MWEQLAAGAIGLPPPFLRQRWVPAAVAAIQVEQWRFRGLVDSFAVADEEDFGGSGALWRSLSTLCVWSCLRTLCSCPVHECVFARFRMHAPSNFLENELTSRDL